MSNEDQEQDLPSLIAQRQSKLAALKEEGLTLIQMISAETM